MAQEQQFQWKLAVNPLVSWQATVTDDTITVKYGLRTWKVPVSGLKYLYAAKGAVLGEAALNNANQAMDGAAAAAGGRFDVSKADQAIVDETVGEILVCHEHNGKRKTVRLSAPHDNAGVFHAEASRFMDAVVALRPEIDVRSLGRERAHALLGVTDGSKIASAIVIGIVVVLAIGAAVAYFA